MGREYPLHHHKISIHALCEEGDEIRAISVPPTARFLSTPSARRATAKYSSSSSMPIFLSTPSARRATKTVLPPTTAATNFYPRPLRGGRPWTEKP